MLHSDPDESLSEATWPLVTINILVYNRKEDVRVSLQKIAQDLEYPRERLEIIVVDNASTDGVGETIAREFPDVKLVVIPKNQGVAGWNAGFEAGRGDYFLVLDDDSTPAPGPGFKAAIRYLEENRKVGILACNIVGGLFTTQELEDKQEWVGFVGCGAIIRRAVVEAVGGYARWLHLYSHEWEYGIRCLNSGFHIRYFEQCIVSHRSSSVNRSSRRMIAYTTRNELLIVYKYFSSRRLLFLLRTLIHNAWLWKMEGRRAAVLYVSEGFLMFLRAAPTQARTPVKPQVQKFYADTFWSTQSITRRVARKLGRKLGIVRQQDAPEFSPPGQ